MNLLLSTNGLRRLREFSRAPRCLFAFDYDGTLSKIVDHPDEAILNEKIFDLLVELSRATNVAVISGRSVLNLRERLPSEIPHLIGNHGLEEVSVSEEMKSRCSELTQRWADFFDANESVISAEGAKGFERENKNLSLSLHYRHCVNHALAKRILLKFVYQLSPLPRVVDGKSVLNLIPQGSPHKGVALLNLMRKLQVDRAIYVGDDETDEDVFHLRDERLLTIRIGKKKTSHAQYYLKTQTEIGQLLKRLLADASHRGDHEETETNAKKSVGL